jgi:hypothetical protein
MDSAADAKKELSELIRAYYSVSKVVEGLRDDGLLNPHDCDNILGHLKSGMIEDVLNSARAHMTQDLAKNAVKTGEEYLTVKKALESQKFSADDTKEILDIFFKK